MISYLIVSDSRILVTSLVSPVLWGSTYLVTTELLPPGRPLLAGLLRALPAGLLLLAVVAATRGPVLPRGRWWWRAAVLGTLNIGLFFPLLFAAAYRLPGGVAAVLGAISPFVVAVLARLLLGVRPPLVTWPAAALGLLGVALLVLRSGAVLDPLGLLAAAAGTLVMSTGVVLGRRWGLPDAAPATARIGVGPGRSSRLLALTAWQLVAGGLLLIPVTLLVEGAPPALGARNLLGFGYLALCGTALGYVLWFRAVVALDPVRVALLTLLSPVTAAVLGRVVLGQALTAGQVLGAGLVLGAVLLGAFGPRPGPDPAGGDGDAGGHRPRVHPSDDRMSVAAGSFVARA